MNSIIQSRKECFICRVSRVDLHHVFNGSNRSKSDNDGMTIWVCREHHNLIHANQELDNRIKALAQKRYMEYYQATTEDFITRYGKNYL